MKESTVVISTKDGKLRHYEGPGVYVSYAPAGLCRVMEEDDSGLTVLDIFNMSDIDEMVVRFVDVDDNRPLSGLASDTVKEVMSWRS